MKAKVLSEPFSSYDLSQVRPGHLLVVNNQMFGQQSIVSMQGGEKHVLVAQGLFSGSELSLLLPLVESLPDYCPYEVLYASFFFGSTSAQAVEKARETILDIMDEGGPQWDQLVRPLRNVMTRVRYKLRPFRLEIVSFLHTGYLLQPYEKTSRGRRQTQQG